MAHDDEIVIANNESLPYEECCACSRHYTRNLTLHHIANIIQLLSRGGIWDKSINRAPSPLHGPPSSLLTPSHAQAPLTCSTSPHPCSRPPNRLPFMNSVLGWVGKDSLLGFGSKDVNGGSSGAPGTRNVVSKKCGHAPMATTHSCPVGKTAARGGQRRLSEHPVQAKVPE